MKTSLISIKISFCYQLKSLDSLLLGFSHFQFLFSTKSLAARYINKVIILVRWNEEQWDLLFLFKMFWSIKSLYDIIIGNRNRYLELSKTWLRYEFNIKNLKIFISYNYK